jgi:exodeoxyribonuclease VII small subunit
MTEKKTDSFEAEIIKLEEIVVSLEKGDMPLEQAIQLYEDGAKIASSCQELLQQAQQRIFNVTLSPDQQATQLEVYPFDA